MRNKLRAMFGREKPPDPIKLAANRLFALQEAEMLAHLHAFVQEQRERPIPAASPYSSVIEAEVRVIEVVPVEAASSPARPQSRPQSRPAPAKSAADFRAWQAEVFGLGDETAQPDSFGSVSAPGERR